MLFPVHISKQSYDTLSHLKGSRKSEIKNITPCERTILSLTTSNGLHFLTRGWTNQIAVKIWLQSFDLYTIPLTLWSSRPRARIRTIWPQGESTISMAMTDDFPTITTKKFGLHLVKPERAFGMEVGCTFERIEQPKPTFVDA